MPKETEVEMKIDSDLVKPPWRELLLKALHLNRAKPEAKYVQLATVNRKGLPKNRTVVFRGWSNDGGFYIHSDKRSGKNQDIMYHSGVEICWYFAKTREQFRLTANANIMTKHCHKYVNILEQHWNQLSTKAKHQYFQQKPGIPFDPENSKSSDIKWDEEEIPNAFTMLHIAPTKVDYLDLKGEPHHRLAFELTDNGDWSMRNLVP